VVIDVKALLLFIESLKLGRTGLAVPSRRTEVLDLEKASA
jgi:hypothetical protein